MPENDTLVKMNAFFNFRASRKKVSQRRGAGQMEAMARSVLECGGKPGRDAAFELVKEDEGPETARPADEKRCRRCRLAPCISATALHDAVAFFGSQ